MGSLISVSIDLSKIKPEDIKVTEKGQRFVNLVVGVNDETNGYGQNASVTIEQTKEQRDNKVAKQYLGNGRVFWTSGQIAVADKKTTASGSNEDAGTDNDLPF